MIKKFSIIFVSVLFLSTLSIQAQNTIQQLIRQGISLHDKGNYPEAISCYEKALKENPNSMSAIYEMSLSYLKEKNYNEAIKYSSRIIDSNFQALLEDAYIVKSSAYASLNNLDMSIKLLNEALDRCGDEYLLHYNLGLSYFKKSEDCMAIDHLRKAISLDETQPNAFLLYAYALNDAGRWVQSFYAFHFFLLLEPNTKRSQDAFEEMYDLISTPLNPNSDKLYPEEGIDRRRLYNELQKKRALISGPDAKFIYFKEASKLIFFTLGQMQDDSENGLLWNLFVPTYEGLIESGHFDTYCHYVSAAYFPKSLTWWNLNKSKVDEFIKWFKSNQNEDQPKP